MIEDVKCVQCILKVDDIKDNTLIEFMNVKYDEIVPFMFIVRVKNGMRDKLKAYLWENDIETAIKYVPSHLFKLYRQDNCPVTEQAFEEILELPLHCRLSDEDVETVIKTVNAFEKSCQ